MNEHYKILKCGYFYLSLKDNYSLLYAYLVVFGLFLPKTEKNY